MERDLNNDEFEIFLKQKVDQHKLYPSDKAWRGIYNSLHPGMKWFKIGGSLLILSTLFIVYQETSIFNSSSLSSKKTALTNTTAITTPGALKGKVTNSVFSKPANNSPEISTGKTVTENNNESVTALATTSLNNTNAVNNIEEIAGNPLNNSDIGNNPDGFSQSNTSKTRNTLNGFFLHNINLLGLNAPVTVAIPSNNLAVKKQDEQIDAALATGNSVSKPITSTVIGNAIISEETVSVKDLNWLQEMAAIKLTPPKRSKFNLQFYFSPTVSYRRLADNQNTSHSNLLNAPSIPRDLNINRYVDHNPAIGAELGSNILFSLTRNFILKSGLQLNYSRYNIQAFKSTYEKASIALTNAGRIADTISSYTSLRNFNGYASEDLQNQYLQVSVPIGAELKLIGTKRLQFSVAGTIQPTFLLFSDTYLLSTNYINYTKEPSLVRKWNVHSSFEAFLSYKTGGLRWQLGPQFRYQLMSSFNDRYPIKEYLFEYGVKIGVSKTLR